MRKTGMTPTLDQIAPGKMTVVCDDWWNTILKEQVYQARVCFDGEPTSIRCFHNHKTPEATTKCQRLILDEMTGYLETAHAVTTVDEDTFEIHYTGKDAYGDEGPRALRFRWKEDE